MKPKGNFNRIADEKYERFNLIYILTLYFTVVENFFCACILFVCLALCHLRAIRRVYATLTYTDCSIYGPALTILLFSFVCSPLSNVHISKDTFLNIISMEVHPWLLTARFVIELAVMWRSLWIFSKEKSDGWEKTPISMRHESIITCIHFFIAVHV